MAGGGGANQSSGNSIGNPFANAQSTPSASSPSNLGGQSNARPSYAMNGTALGQPQQPQPQANRPLWGQNALSNLPTFAQNAFNGRPDGAQSSPAQHGAMFGSVSAPPQLAGMSNALSNLTQANGVAAQNTAQTFPAQNYQQQIPPWLDTFQNSQAFKDFQSQQQALQQKFATSPEYQAMMQGQQQWAQQNPYRGLDYDFGGPSFAQKEPSYPVNPQVLPANPQVQQPVLQTQQQDMRQRMRNEREDERKNRHAGLAGLAAGMSGSQYIK